MNYESEVSKLKKHYIGSKLLFWFNHYTDVRGSELNEVVSKWIKEENHSYKNGDYIQSYVYKFMNNLDGLFTDARYTELKHQFRQSFINEFEKPICVLTCGEVFNYQANGYKKDEEEKRVAKLTEDKRFLKLGELARRLYFDAEGGSEEETIYNDFLNKVGELHDALAKIDNERTSVLVGRVLALKSTVKSKSDTSKWKVLTHFSDGQDLIGDFDGSSEEHLPTVYSLSSNKEIGKIYDLYEGLFISVFIYLDTNNGTYHLSRKAQI